MALAMTLSASSLSPSLPSSFPPGRGAACAILLSLTLCACSFVAVKPPPDSPVPGAPIKCTTSRLAPKADVAGSVLWTIGALGVTFGSLLNDANQSFDDYKPFLGIGLAHAALATLSTIGAIRGYRHTRRCRQLQGVSIADPDGSHNPVASTGTP